MKVLALRDKTTGKYHSRSGYFYLTDNFGSIGFYSSLGNLNRHLARVAKAMNREKQKYAGSNWDKTLQSLMENAEIVEFELFPKTIDPLESQDIINQKCLSKVKE